jgi:hypothetical protein
MRIIAATVFSVAILASLSAGATPADNVADALVEAARKPITADSLETDFSRLTRFVRHNGNGLILYTDGGPADGYVRHAQARYDLTPTIRKGIDMIPQFDVAIELVDQPDFTYEAVASALERRLGTPMASSNQAGALFRTWVLKKPEGRTITLAYAPASDNAEATTIFQLIQNR